IRSFGCNTNKRGDSILDFLKSLWSFVTTCPDAKFVNRPQGLFPIGIIQLARLFERLSKLFQGLVELSVRYVRHIPFSTDLDRRTWCGANGHIRITLLFHLVLSPDSLPPLFKFGPFNSQSQGRLFVYLIKV